jgi:hypothetical protein|tara:strand:+ start:596 stop:1681 length:1086 start_codon:yes stop_codon:yes gene_type:complete
MELSPEAIRQANDFNMFSQYIHTWESRQFLNIPEKTIALFFGNQRGKGAMTCMGYIHRVMGTHPIPERNINYFECANGHKFSPSTWLNGLEMRYKDGLCPKCPRDNRKEVRLHKRGNKIIRFAGDILPESEGGKSGEADGSKEVKSVQYLEFMKWCPPFLIHNPLTSRKKQIGLYDPYGGDDIIFEFVSYKMPVESTRGHQRISIWADELGSEGFYDEQRPRLMIEKGDFIITYTVTEDTKSTILFDQIYDRAKVYYRSQFMLDEYYKKICGETKAQIERTNSNYSIAVIESASDDNPVLSTENVIEYLMEYPDPEVQMMRRFCVFTQLSSRIFPQFDWSVHSIDLKKAFEEETSRDKVVL